MIGVHASTPDDRAAVVDGLRRWAVGVLSDQAAVELLANYRNGRFVRPGVAWVKPCVRPGWFWLDADALADYAATRTGDEQRILTLAARLVVDPWTSRRPTLGRRAAA